MFFAQFDITCSPLYVSGGYFKSLVDFAWEVLADAAARPSLFVLDSKWFVTINANGVRPTVIAMSIFAGFLFSCAVLLLLSWVFTLWPGVAWHADRHPGVPVKDYIVQSGEFVLCAFGSLHIALNAFELKRYLTGLVFVGLALSFLANVFYVETSTGSITEHFRQSAVGQTGMNAIISTNPHNQTFAVAIQLGILGAIVLYAMWISHTMLFLSAGQQGWIGTLLVIQNVFSSVFNTHLFDFTQGWMYVFGVGVIGGDVMQRRRNVPSCQQAVRKVAIRHPKRGRL